MRQPPDMSLVCLCIIFSVKPRPCRSSQARGSNVSGSILSSFSPMTPSISAFFSASSSMSLLTSSVSRSCSFATTSTTAWMAVTSSGLASESKNHMSTCFGIGISRAAIAASMVDLPEPFWPIRPMRRPNVSSSLVSLMNSLPYTLRENWSILTSLLCSWDASTPVTTAVSRTASRLTFEVPSSIFSFSTLSWAAAAAEFLAPDLALALAFLAASSLRPMAAEASREGPDRTGP
mmetsp:Transcript_105600/g.275743  ORF Transcript_105600/g.275743 Transcript_105600/m.275743 type:complete len:234 (-) Transcript_105600:23-724(-)